MKKDNTFYLYFKENTFKHNDIITNNKEKLLIINPWYLRLYNFFFVKKLKSLYKYKVKLIE